MDLHTTSATPQRRPAPSTEEMMDEFSFKPLTEGLGFHHGNKKAEEAVQIARQQVAERSIPVRQMGRNEHPFTSHQRGAGTTAPTTEYVQNDLALFYAPKAEIGTLPELEERLPVAAREADLSVRGIAYLLDLVFIAGMTWVTFALIGFLTEIDFAASLWEGHGEMWAVVGVLFSGYFMLYFTVLEKFQGGSIGKETLDLRVVTTEGNGPSLLRAAARTLITLVGTLSLGFTAWVDLAGKLTNTKVIRR